MVCEVFCVMQVGKSSALLSPLRKIYSVRFGRSYALESRLRNVYIIELGEAVFCEVFFIKFT